MHWGHFASTPAEKFHMKRITTRLAPTVFLGAIAATGCVHISTTPLATTGPAISPDSVQVFATKTPSEYRELAVLRAKRFLVSDRKTLAALRKEAAELGADGILLTNAANAGTQHHEGTGVIWTRKRPDVITSSSTTTIDAFERAVAIKVEKP
jgi:hypothetical protein